MRTNRHCRPAAGETVDTYERRYYTAGITSLCGLNVCERVRTVRGGSGHDELSKAKRLDKDPLINRGEQCNVLLLSQSILFLHPCLLSMIEEAILDVTTQGHLISERTLRVVIKTLIHIVSSHGCFLSFASHPVRCSLAKTSPCSMS